MTPHRFFQGYRRYIPATPWDRITTTSASAAFSSFTSSFRPPTPWLLRSLITSSRMIGPCVNIFSRYCSSVGIRYHCTLHLKQNSLSLGSSTPYHAIPFCPSLSICTDLRSFSPLRRSCHVLSCSQEPHPPPASGVTSLASYLLRSRSSMSCMRSFSDYQLPLPAKFLVTSLDRVSTLAVKILSSVMRKNTGSDISSVHDHTFCSFARFCCSLQAISDSPPGIVEVTDAIFPPLHFSRRDEISFRFRVYMLYGIFICDRHFPSLHAFDHFSSLWIPLSRK